VEGAKVVLWKDSGKLKEAVTDNYGDFKFDGLEEKSGQYVITIKADDFEEKGVQVDLAESVYLGDIYV
jgi:hypothetical protein